MWREKGVKWSQTWLSSEHREQIKCTDHHSGVRDILIIGQGDVKWGSARLFFRCIVNDNLRVLNKVIIKEKRVYSWIDKYFYFWRLGPEKFAESKYSSDSIKVMTSVNIMSEISYTKLQSSGTKQPRYSIMLHHVSYNTNAHILLWNKTNELR